MIQTAWPRLRILWCWAPEASTLLWGSVSPHRGLSAEREAGRVHWLRGCEKRRSRSLVYFVSFGICVWGRSLSWGWRLWSGRLVRAWASEPPNYPVLFLSWRKSMVRSCLPSPLCRKAVRCKGFSLQMEGEFFLPLWWMVLPPFHLDSNPALLVLAEKKLGIGASVLTPLYSTNRSQQFCSSLSLTWLCLLCVCNIPNIWISRQEQENDSLF